MSVHCDTLNSSGGLPRSDSSVGFNRSDSSGGFNSSAGGGFASADMVPLAVTEISVEVL